MVRPQEAWRNAASSVSVKNTIVAAATMVLVSGCGVLDGLYGQKNSDEQFRDAINRGLRDTMGQGTCEKTGGWWSCEADASSESQYDDLF